MITVVNFGVAFFAGESSMELLEYQAKELFRQIGIPVLPSQRINQLQDLKGLTIPYPVVLKSQVYTGGRGKAGGIKFVENTIDAIAAAQAIFHLPIMGRYPEVLLAEAKYDADREFYLAVVLDVSSRRPLLLGSQHGGIEIESKLDQLYQVIVEHEFSPFYARRLAIKMGLQGDLIQAVSAIVEKMYRLFVEYDLDLVEINPLAVSPSGRLMALDGKVTVNDAALGRQASLSSLVDPLPAASPSQTPVSSVKLVELEGNIGVLCNGAGLTMATMDLIHKAKGKPAGFVDVGGEYRQNCQATTLEERILEGLDLLIQKREVKAILVNLLGSILPATDIANVILAHLQKRNLHHPLPAIVLRLAGTDLEQAKESLAAIEVPVLESLDQAITQVVTLTKAKPA